MRRWMLTAGLALAAGVAALLAPRLLERARSAPEPWIVETPLVPRVAPPVATIVEALPPEPPDRPDPPVSAGIPELENPVSPNPVGIGSVELDPFWDDCPGCGMG